MYNVLIVEDHDRLQKQLDQFYEQEGFRVSTASCGEDGIKKLAEEKFRVSLGLFRTTSIYNHLGTSLSAQGLYGGSVFYYLEALKLNPWNTKVTENLTESLRKSPGILRTSSFWRLASALPQQAVIHNNIGVLLAQKGARQESRLFFDKALTADPSFAPARHNRGLLEDGPSK